MLRARREGFETLTLGARTDELQATFVPGAGIVCCSLRHRGRELLAQRDGVLAYAERGATMGIPLLYPWANRLAGLGYAGPHGAVELARAESLLKLDANGLPIHGALPGLLAWELLDDGDGGKELLARLPWERAELLAIYPWRHEVELRAGVAGATLTIETSVRAGEEGGLPVSFGYHPYIALPGGERGAWELELPVSRRLALDAQMIPTGASEPFEHRRFALAQSDWDDAFAGLTAPPVFTATSAAVSVAVEFERGYSHAQLYAPAGERFVCFEPMTAPTNALRSGEGLARLAPGEVYRAAFAITVGA